MTHTFKPGDRVRLSKAAAPADRRAITMLQAESNAPLSQIRDMRPALGQARRLSSCLGCQARDPAPGLALTGSAPDGRRHHAQSAFQKATRRGRNCRRRRC